MISWVVLLKTNDMMVFFWHLRYISIEESDTAGLLVADLLLSSGVCAQAMKTFELKRSGGFRCRFGNSPCRCPLST